MQGNTVIYLFVLAYWLIGLPFLVYLNKKYDDLLHPAGPLLALTFLYAIGPILYQHINGITIYGDLISEKTALLFCVACLLGELGIIGGALIVSLRPKKSSFRLMMDTRTIRLAIPVMIVLASILAVLTFDYVLSSFDITTARAYSDWALSSRVDKMNAGAFQPVAEVIYSMVPTALLLGTGIVLTFKGRLPGRLIGMLILGANVITMALSGSRSGMFMALTAISIFFHYRVHQLRVASVAIGVLIAMLLLNGISLVRSTSQIAEMHEIFRNEVGGDMIRLLNPERSGEFLTGMNLMRLMEAVSSGETYLNYGKGFLDDLAVFVPRLMFPNRPLPLSEKFVEEFYPGIREQGMGYGLYFLQDGYWAFGLPGVLLSMFIFSWVLSRIYCHILPSLNSDFPVLVYAFTYFPLVIASPRSGLILSFKSAAMGLIPFVMVLLVVFCVNGLFGRSSTIARMRSSRDETPDLSR